MTGGEKFFEKLRKWLQKLWHAGSEWVMMQDGHCVWNPFPDTGVSGTQLSDSFKEAAKQPCRKNTKSVQGSRNYEDGWTHPSVEDVLAVAELHASGCPGALRIIKRPKSRPCYFCRITYLGAVILISLGLSQLVFFSSDSGIGPALFKLRIC